MYCPGTLIDHRPPAVEDRTRFGDWEGDLIIGTRTRSAIGTLVERKSGCVVLLHPDAHILRGAYSNPYRRMLSALLSAARFRRNDSAYRPLLKTLDLVVSNVTASGSLLTVGQGHLYEYRAVPAWAFTSA